MTERDLNVRFVPHKQTSPKLPELLRLPGLTSLNRSGFVEAFADLHEARHLKSKFPAMSLMGPKRTSQSYSAMSAFGGKADMTRRQ
jgi:hypothetical protein